MKKLLYIATFCLCSVWGMAQHGPLISQYMLNGLPLNPAFAGARDATSVVSTFRNQWTGMQGAPKTGLLTAHAPLKNESLALGFMAYSDRIGVSSQTGISVSAAYRMRLGSGRLSMGLSGGFNHTKNAWSDIITEEDNDLSFSSGNDQYLLPDFGAGVYYYSKKAYASLSLPSLMGVEYSGGEGYVVSSRIREIEMYFNTGYQLTINPDWNVIPSVMMKWNNASVSQMDYNLKVNYKDNFELGCSYRSSKDLVFMFRAHANPQLSIGYAFDYTMSDLARYTNGSHEVTLQYDFKYKSTATAPRFF